MSPSSLKHRYDFVLLFDVQDGNPNGDPDAGNLPRMDPETGEGLVSDVALKRKIRNYVGVKHGEKPPYEIYIKEKAVLNRQHERAYTALGVTPKSKSLPKDAERAREITQWMCANFFDVRTFGAVMGLEVNAGQVRGPVQLTFGRSIGPVLTLEHSITRVAVATEQEAEQQQGRNRTMGRKYTIPYALYRAHGFVSAPLAQQTGFSETDLELLWEALTMMFDHDRSSSHGYMSTRGLFVFEHDSALGRAPAHTLFERVRVERGDPVGTPREFGDFRVEIDAEELPSGVTLHRYVG